MRLVCSGAVRTQAHEAGSGGCCTHADSRTNAAPKKVEKESELLFYVGADRNDSFSMLPFTYHDAVVRGCVERLRAGSSAGVDVTDKSFSRGEAIKKGEGGITQLRRLAQFEVRHDGPNKRGVDTRICRVRSRHCEDCNERK